jgi:hypothetical protein
VNFASEPAVVERVTSAHWTYGMDDSPPRSEFVLEKRSVNVPCRQRWMGTYQNVRIASPTPFSVVHNPVMNVVTITADPFPKAFASRVK